MNDSHVLVCGICNFRCDGQKEMDLHDSDRHPMPVAVRPTGYCSSFKSPQEIDILLSNGDMVRYKFGSMLDYRQKESIINIGGMLKCIKQ